MNGTTVNAVLREALSHHQDGRLDQAFVGYQSVLQAVPDHPDALALAGMCAFHMNRLEAARRLLEDAAQAGADGPDPACTLAVSEAALARGFAHAGLLAVKGSCLLDLDRVTDAQHALADSVALASDDPDVHHLLGIALRRLGRPADALVAFDRAIALKTPFPEAHFNRGNAMSDLGQMRDAVLAFAAAGEQAPADKEIQRRLGTAFRQLGRLEDAEKVFDHLVARHPNDAAGWYQLGMTRVRRPDRTGAKYALDRALQADPGHPSARHMLAALKGETPEIAPAGHVRRVFDDYADRFEAHVVGTLGYRVPEQMRAAVDGVLARRPAAVPLASALDLGCGTGLVARHFEGVAAATDGVDLSPRMVRKALATGRYRTVIEGDLMAALGGGELAQSYDLVLAGDVFIYVGALDGLFAAIAALQAKGGLFTFSIESLTAAEEAAAPAGYRLQSTGRYAHGDGCIARLAADFGYAVLIADPIEVRNQGGEPTPGMLYVLERA
ncbi:MAG: tetratricopeptide repeat protein [Proteobacteria bacterium]|nr:tetratricopeptide repeat protein [Pseudomonadota bacterium]